MGSRRKARECALQMLFAADVAETPPDEVVRTYWAELGDVDLEESAREFATRLAAGTLAHLQPLDERIRSRAEHWRIAGWQLSIATSSASRFTNFFTNQPSHRGINEALEIARLFHLRSTQFINGNLMPSSATLMSNSHRARRVSPRDQEESSKAPKTPGTQKNQKMKIRLLQSSLGFPSIQPFYDSPFTIYHLLFHRGSNATTVFGRDRRLIEQIFVDLDELREKHGEGRCNAR